MQILLVNTAKDLMDPRERLRGPLGVHRTTPSEKRVEKKRTFDRLKCCLFLVDPRPRPRGPLGSVETATVV